MTDTSPTDTAPPTHGSETAPADPRSDGLDGLGLDAALTGWLDAVRQGGFPSPSRADRWQPLRAGVVNMWEFEAAEYWYADGWVQLTGRNETGKSSLMALTTLIPWLADTSSTNIDTLGRSGKRFRYYVEPSGKDGDRRPNGNSTNRGWVWVEYGRLESGEPRFFTTLLFAEARAASSGVTLSWCTAEGPRVRAGLDLAPNRIPATPKELAASDFIAHPTAGAYRAHVAANLLGTSPERLEAVGKMLRVTRQPKLGAELHVAFVSQHLRDALPELDRSEVDALAAGWDQLDQIRADLAATQQAAKTVDRFRNATWLPWVRADIRQRADAASRARTEFDRVTRDERAATEAVETHEKDERQATAAWELAGRDADAARAAGDELQGSARYLDAQARLASLEERRREAASQESLHRDHTRDAEWATSAKESAEAEVAASESARERAAEAVGSARDSLALAAAHAGAPIDSGAVDLPVLQQRLEERREAVKRTKLLLRKSENAGATATSQEGSAVERRATATGAREHADAAWAQAESERDALVAGLAAWAGAVRPSPPTATVDSWVAALPSEVDADGAVRGVGVRDLVRADWHDPERTVLLRREQDAARRRAEAEALASDLSAQIEGLVAAPVPIFDPPTAWVRRRRPDASAAGAPLWALLDPRPGVSPTVLARVEAALAAMGLLDAWVSDDGVYSPARDGDDATLSLVGGSPALGDGGDGATGSLHDLLTPGEGPQPLTSRAAALLRRVMLIPAGEQVPDDGLAVGEDGRWRAHALAGRAAPRHPEAEWIGESARAAQRRRAIEQLTLRLDAARADMRDAASEERAAAAAIAELAKVFARCPGDAGLRTSLVRAHEREQAAERAAAEASRAEERAAEARAAAEHALARLIEFCADRELPRDATGLDSVVDAVADARRALLNYQTALRSLHDAERHLGEARNRLEERRVELDERSRRLAETARRLAEVRATVAALEATIGADDQEVLAELERLRASEQQARGERERLDDVRMRIGEGLGRARAVLVGAQAKRVAVTGERDAAFARFRVAVDRGLVEEAGLELPEPTASTVDRVREQVAAARRQLEVARWPDDAEAQSKEVDRRARLLVQGAHEVRVELEAGGRTLTIDYDDLGLPRVGVQVDSTGVLHGPREASARLGQIHAELDAAYSRRVQETLDELLGSTFLEHLRERVGTTDALVKHINRVLARHPVQTTSTSLRIDLEAATEQDRIMLEAVRGPSLANPEVAGRVREHLRSRVEEAKSLAASAGEADWRDRLADTLDYRQWFGVNLRRKIGQGGWAPLTSQTFAEMSGGARAVILMLPLVATLAALYEDMDAAPRPLWLDEAFDGLDAANRATVMELFREFDFDVLLAGPNRLVNVKTVPTAAIYQVVRAPAPLPGVDLTLELWAGGDLVAVDLPATLPTGEAALGRHGGAGLGVGAGGLSEPGGLGGFDDPDGDQETLL